MTTGESIEPLIEEATDWLLRLEEAPGDSRLRTAAEAWRRENPEHAIAWRRAERAYGLMARAKPQDAPPTPRRQPAVRRWRVATGAALAACLMLVLLPGILLRLQSDIATGTGEMQRATLADGTVVELSPRTALDVRFSAARRTVALLSGQAFFSVVADRNRPFDIVAGDVTVTVVGTAFDVRLSDETMTVGVQHGAVEVRSVAPDGTAQRLGPGDRLTVDRRDGAMRRVSLPPDEIASWRDHRLFVEGATIGDVAHELERYRRGWIVFADPGFARQRVTGLYDLGDPDRALRVLIGPFGGHVREVTPLLSIVSGP